MASVVIPNRSGQYGNRRGLSADQSYYCFDCDRRLTIIATSDTGIIVCPICGHVVLEEFETPSSPPPPPPPPPLPPSFPMPQPPRSTASVGIESFFPNSLDNDSDVDSFDLLPPPRPPLPRLPPSFPMPQPPRSTASVGIESFFPTSLDIDDEVNPFDLLPPPPPPSLPFFFTTRINTTSTGGQTRVHRDVIDSLSHLDIYPPPPPPPWDFPSTLDSDVRDLRIPSSPPLPPPPPVIDPSVLIPLPPPSESELGEFRLSLENSVPSSPPYAPSRASDASDIFYSPSRDPDEEENPPSPQPPSPQPPSPQPPSPQQLYPPPPISYNWEFFFSPDLTDLPFLQPNNLPNHEISSDLQPNNPANQENSPSDLLPPSPPPWLISDLSVMIMTEELLSDWKTQQCSICIDNFEVNQMVKLTPCNHLYHSGCLSRWLNLHKSCPICRHKLSSQ